MMSRLVFVICVCLGLLGSGTRAEAGIPYGYGEIMDFVMEMPEGAEFTGGTQASLCHLVWKFHIAFVPLFYWSEGYVISDNRCTADGYWPVTADQLAGLKATGIVPANIPDTPGISWQRRLPTALVALFFGCAILIKLRNASRQRARFEIMGTMSKPAKRLLDTLCHAARSNGQVSEHTSLLIANLASQVAGRRVEPSLVHNACTGANPNLTSAEFTLFANGLNTAEQDTTMQAVVMVLGSAGQVSKGGERFLVELAKACKMNQKRLQSVMGRAQAA